MTYKKVMVLGTEYIVKFGNSNNFTELQDMDGFTDTSLKLIVVDDMTDVQGEVGFKKDLDKYQKTVVRHELIHAFLAESGLENNALSTDCWSTNEEMIDWFAIQFPKIIKAFEECDCL